MVFRDCFVALLLAMTPNFVAIVSAAKQSHAALSSRTGLTPVSKNEWIKRTSLRPTPYRWLYQCDRDVSGGNALFCVGLYRANGPSYAPFASAGIAMTIADDHGSAVASLLAGATGAVSRSRRGQGLRPIATADGLPRHSGPPAHRRAPRSAPGPRSPRGGGTPDRVAPERLVPGNVPDPPTITSREAKRPSQMEGGRTLPAPVGACHGLTRTDPHMPPCPAPGTRTNAGA
jgi:hypothetical protein